MSDADKKATKKVIFLHGLEAGPNGPKVDYLRERYEVEAPDMSMSVYDIEKKHSFINSSLSIIWEKGILLPIVDYPKFRSESVMMSFKQCCDSVRDLVANAEDGTLLIGSSWGGAVALWLISEGVWHGDTILFAPALDVLFLQVQYTTAQKEEVYKAIKAHSIDKGHRIVVLHGDLDIIVPLKDSTHLCKKIGAELIIVPLGDHNINRYLVAENNLESIIYRLAMTRSISNRS